MTNPQDPRTPQERAYSLDEAHEPTEVLRASHDPEAPRASQDPTEVLHTADPTEAYGQHVPNPTLAMPRYDPRFDPEGPPPPRATEVLGYAPPGPPPASPPPVTPVDPDPAPRGPRWGRIALAAVVLLGLGAIIGVLLTGSGDDTATTAAPTTTRAPVPTTTAPPTTTTQPSAPTELPFEQVPGGIGEFLGDTGAVIGTITANDGTSLTVSIMGGSLVTVEFTEATQVIAITGSNPADLPVGSTVMATGSPVEQGRMTAETVISASLGSFGRPGN